MTVTWFCLCGWSTPDAREAFQHRDGFVHHIRPMTANEAELIGIVKPFNGIDRHFAEKEITEVCRPSLNKF
jgi:hypothetical protein